jgi:cytochrome c
MYKAAGAALLAAGLMLLAQSPKYGVGRAPTPEEIRSMDITIPPDGTGLPAGRGTAAQGRDIYSRRCSRCHGPKGEGGDEPKQSILVGGKGSLKTPKPLKTVGSYWPYATTVWDYVNRSTAFVLFLNGIVAENDVLDAKTLPQIRMPNRDGFTSDPRPDVGEKILKPKKGAPTPATRKRSS